MKLKLLIFFLLVGFTFALHAQKSTVLDSAEINLNNQLLVFPHEKLYLHTDKPYYITGEKIFFRAFLLDALSNRASILSRYVYVELINPADSVVQRIKIKPDEDNLFHGAILLPEDLTQGNYKIRAYTQYMYNQGESSFFSKYVIISDPQVLSVQTESDFKFADNGKVNASLRFINAKTQEVIKPQSVNLRLNRDRQFTAKPDKEGWTHVNLNLPSKTTTRTIYVEFVDNNHVYKQYIRIPYPVGDFDVSFYPEGGYLITGQPTNVAFKAINSGGAALNIEGEIVDSKGNKIGEIKTTHEGMGDFFINPQQDEHYHAICRYGNREQRFDLPVSQKNAFALKTLSKDNKLLIAINKYDSASYPEHYLMIHSGGSVFYAEPWDHSKDYITFDKTSFPSGISHILLLTKDLQTVSERLVFQLIDGDNGIAEFQTQKDSYRKREQVKAGIKVNDGESKTLKGNFSIAVTNDNEVAVDTTLSIMSEVLLSSELKGHIENPQYYFQKGNKRAELAADLLMKTHGWTRYSVPDVIRGKLSYPTISFEESQKITGTVKSGLLSRLAKNFNISLISLETGFFDITETDENGHYIFENFEFPDSTKYVIQALNGKGKGKQMTELFIDEDTFPKIHSSWIDPIVREEKSDPLLLDYVAKADLHYTYENGMRIINLPEVKITARSRNDEKNRTKYKSSLYSSPDNFITEEEIERSGAIDVKSLLYRIPGLMIMGDKISIRGAKGNPLIIIDNMPFIPPDEDGSYSIFSIIDLVNVHDIGQIDVLKNVNNLAMYGMRGANGVIVIHTKRGEMRAAIPSYNIRQIMPLGYQTPVEFYSPKYDTQESINDSKPDLRTTIYWKPNVVTDDSGNINLDFYTADDTATYSVIIEGMSDDGKLIHYLKNAVIKVE